MRRLLRALLSRRVAVALMLAMAAVLALASLVPEPDLADPERLAALAAKHPIVLALFRGLRPDRIAASPAFLVLPALVFASTAYSIATRVRAELARRRRGLDAPLARAQRMRFRAARAREIAAPVEAALTAARGAVGRAGFALVEGAGLSPNEIHATRGGLGFAGSIVFHLGILVVLVGIVVSSSGRCGGEVMLAEGFTATLPSAVIRPSNPRALAGLEGVTVGVRDFAAEYQEGDMPVDFAAVFEVSRAAGERSATVVRVNGPVWVDDYQFTLHRYGFAPTMVVTRGDLPLADGTAALKVLPPGTEDGLALADGSELRIALYPDHAQRGGASVSRTLAPVNPVLVIRHLVNGVEVARGSVRRGEDEQIGALRIGFPALAYWVDFIVSRDPGLPWIALGSGLIALGLAVRFALHPEAVRVTVTRAEGGASLDLTLDAEYFPALAEARAEALVAEIAERAVTPRPAAP